MKPKSHAAIVRSMKAYKKKVPLHTTADAIGKKLKEIEKTSRDTEREGKMVLFRHLR